MPIDDYCQKKNGGNNSNKCSNHYLSLATQSILYYLNKGCEHKIKKYQRKSANSINDSDKHYYKNQIDKYVNKMNNYQYVINELSDLTNYLINKYSPDPQQEKEQYNNRLNEAYKFINDVYDLRSLYLPDYQYG